MGYAEHNSHRLFGLSVGGLMALDATTAPILARFGDEAAARRFAAKQWPGRVIDPTGSAPRATDPFTEKVYVVKSAWVAASEPGPDLGGPVA